MLHHKTYIHPTSTEWVTFVHGAGGSSSIWYKQIKEFKKNFNVLLVDLRGHGNSKSLNIKSLKKYTFKVIAEDVLEVIDHLEIAKSHFVGISLGTVIIREIAEQRSEIIDSMIMGGAILRLNFKSQVLMKLGFFLKSVIPYILLYKLLAFVVMPRKKHQESRNLFIREAKKLYQNEFIKWFGLTSAVNPILRLFRSKDPGIPTLYVMGDEDHMFIAPVRMTVDRHDSAELIVIEDCGHVVNVDKPIIFNSEVIKWINNLKRVA